MPHYAASGVVGASVNGAAHDVLTGMNKRVKGFKMPLSYDKVDSVVGIGRAGVLRSSTYPASFTS